MLKCQLPNRQFCTVRNLQEVGLVVAIDDDLITTAVAAVDGQVAACRDRDQITTVKIDQRIITVEGDRSPGLVATTA